jgi:hypothetical protein
LGWSWSQLPSWCRCWLYSSNWLSLLWLWLVILNWDHSSRLWLWAWSCDHLRLVWIEISDRRSSRLLLRNILLSWFSNHRLCWWSDNSNRTLLAKAHRLSNN